jgi:hypothetical protein
MPKTRQTSSGSFRIATPGTAALDASGGGRPAGVVPALSICAGLLFAGLQVDPALAETVPLNCVILPGEEVASILMTNATASDATCIVTCKFSTTKYENNPQITCAKPVPAGKEVEMCRLTSGGDKFVKLTEGRAECTRLSGSQ